MAKEATSVIPHRLISAFALETITGTSTLRQLEHYKTAERTDQGRIKYCGKRVNSCGHRKWGRGEGRELGIVPALFPVVRHDVHMIGKDRAEAQLGLVSRLLLGSFCQFNLDFLHNNYTFPFQSRRGALAFWAVSFKKL